MRVNQSQSNQVQGSEVSGTRQTGKAAAAQANKKTEKPNGASTAAATGSASAEISARGREMMRAKEAANAAPDVREEKVAELKRRIAAGGYRVDANAIAEKMVDEHIKTADIG